MPMATKEEQREYQRKWMAARRAAYFNDKVCLNCGANENLELDHINPKLKVTHAIWSWRESRRLEELEKCQVLCHDCHVVKTKTDGSHEHLVGEGANGVKLTDIIVREIRERQKNGATKRGLAREYNVSEKLIRLICNRTIWTHVE